jgi:hypothetical protein
LRHQDLLRHTPCLRSPSASTFPSAPEGVPPLTMPPDPVPPAQIPASTTAPDPVPPPPPVHDDAPVVSEGDHTPLSPLVPADSEGGAHVPLLNPSPAPSFPSRHHGGTWKDGSALDRRYTHGQWNTGFTCLLALPQYALALAPSWAQLPPAIANVGAGHTPRHRASWVCLK